jgi:putative transposase
MQDGFVERFNGSFRDECLNETLFSSLGEARNQITRCKEIITRTNHIHLYAISHPMNIPGK